jgi:hypothetical protein
MFVTIFNACEAALWSVLAMTVAIRFCNCESRLRRASRITSLLLALFAASDVIEMYTGAWWRPPGLLLLKGICLVGLTWSGSRLVRSVRAAARDSAVAVQESNRAAE